jgi:hypothetical protein
MMKTSNLPLKQKSRYFLQEFALEEEKAQHHHQGKKSVDLKKEIESYGSVKESVRPTKKFLMNNPQMQKPPMGPGLLGYGGGGV